MIKLLQENFLISEAWYKPKNQQEEIQIKKTEGVYYDN